MVKPLKHDMLHAWTRGRSCHNFVVMTDHQEWIGRQETVSDVCALPLVRRLAALLDGDPASFRTGDTLPPGWHMILFTPDAPQSALGPDGHPHTGSFLPDLPLPRRMLGGRRTQFLAPIRIGAEVRRVSEITGVEDKQGRSGRLAKVTVRHTIHAGEPAVVEEQDILYREAAKPGAAAPEAAPEPPRPAPLHSCALTPDPALLFRYSAVTFNAHRIHYDHDYATGQEGYPGLVVNGGLTGLLLLELFKQAAGRPPRETAVRNRRTLICGRPLRLCASPAGAGWSLWVEDEAGRVALEASMA
jgi:3-methylfumaryl-CoA hydratase